MIKRLLKDRNTLSFIISIAVFLWVLILSPLLYSLDKKAQFFIKDHFFSTKVLPNIVIVEIDDLTTNNIGRFPFDRKVYAPVVKRLQDNWAAVTAFDVIFADVSDTNSDQIFASSIEASDNVVFWLSFSSRWFLEQPLQIFRDGIKSIGYFSPNVDRFTNTVYSFRPSLYSNKDKQVYEHFSLAILRQYFSFIYNTPIWSINTTENTEVYPFINDIYIPFSSTGKKDILINYSDRNQFKRVSFWELYDEGQFEILQNSSRKIDFSDSIVIIGATAKGIKDTFITPSGIEYGVYIHANIVNTILTRNFLQYFNKNLEWILIFLLIIVSVYFNMSRSGKILILSNISVITLFLIIFPISITWYSWLLINYWAEIVLSLILSLAISNIVKYVIENKHKQKLNKALSEYVSEDIAKEVLSWTGDINLDGEEKDITMFFSDIEGFTTISEKFSPEVLVRFLREYLWEMSDIILDQNWFINKYEWDAIMALWWVFGKRHNTEYDACYSALKQQNVLQQLNMSWSEQGFSEIRARIGIHTWPAIIGNIGSAWRKMEFTALWDNVNLASRLEWVNKFYGTYICISEDVYKKVRKDFECRYLDIIQVKGKEKPVKIYELLAHKWKLSADIKKQIRAFNQAIKLYNSKEFWEALEIFKELAKQGDMPSKTYVSRAQAYKRKSPWDDWTGVWKMSEK